MKSGAIVECVPNFSEGADITKVHEIVRAMNVPGVSLLDWSCDSDHNRSVITVAGSPEAIVEAAVRAAGRASELIDLTSQKGVHPRIGAADVIPFVPVSGISLAECAALARQAGMQLWQRYGVPVYFYEAAAVRPDRVRLEDVRQGQFEGLQEAVGRDATRRPDIGGPELHRTAGASAIGARRFLIAYNIHLTEPDVTAARAIARDLRASGGGMQGVKAMGVLANGRAQITINITDYRAAPMRLVREMVGKLAQRHGAVAVDGELIGLIPEEAYEPDSDWASQISGFDPEEKVLERRLHHPLDWP